MSRKHPHGCGEDPSVAPDMGPDWETPPRVWGRLALGLRYLRLRGNTPTGVGKTPFLPFVPIFPRKHPHGCGEDGLSPVPQYPEKETPPRVWGRRRQATMTPLAIRNTPTGVGKTQ